MLALNYQVYSYLIHLYTKEFLDYENKNALKKTELKITLSVPVPLQSYYVSLV